MSRPADELVARLVAELTPVRRLPGAGVRAAGWGALAIACVGIGVLLLGPRPDLAAKLGEPAFLWENALLLAGFALAARCAFGLGVPGRETSSAPLWAFIAWVASVWLRDAGSNAGSFVCGERMVALALVPSLVMFFRLRRGAPRRRAGSGWLALQSAGSLAMLGTQLVCAKDSAAHVLHWHVLPLLVATLLGAALGRSVLPRA